MRQWLARLSFSFIIVAAVLAWDANRGARGHGPARPAWRVKVQFAAAGVLVGLGLIGTRERHRLLEERGRGEEGRP